MIHKALTLLEEDAYYTEVNVGVTIIRYVSYRFMLDYALSLHEHFYVTAGSESSGLFTPPILSAHKRTLLHIPHRSYLTCIIYYIGLEVL